MKSGIMLPSFGYVLGFIAAAYVVGYLAERGWDRSIPKMFAAMLLVPSCSMFRACYGSAPGSAVRRTPSPGA